jgi:uncharacterized protein YegP (UPF0339 family)
MTRILASLSFIALLATGCAVADDTEVIYEGKVDSAQSDLTSRGSFDLWRADSGFYFNFKAGNGEIMLSSEGYENRMGALNGLLSVLDNGGFESNYKIFEGADGQWYVSLRAANYRIIATGEAYATKSSATRGVNSTISAIAGYLEHWDTNSGARFQVFESDAGNFHFNLYAKNGEVMLTSESYTTEAAALNGAFSVAENGLYEDSYEVLEAANGGFYFNLHAANGEIIGTSEIYENASNAYRAVSSVIDLIPEAELL